MIRIMSYTTSTAARDAIVFSSDIETSEKLIDYINGKARFYVENNYFPLAKPWVKPNTKHEVFVTNDFTTAQGRQITGPCVFVRTDDGKFKSFLIDWAENKRGSDKTYSFSAPFNGWDEATKSPTLMPVDSKQSMLKINIKIADNHGDASDENAKLKRLSQHLTQCLSLLLVCHCFKIDLKQPKYLDADNKTLFKNIVDDMNTVIDAGPKPANLEMPHVEYVPDEVIDAITKDEGIYYVPDPTSPETLPPSVPTLKTESEGVETYEPMKDLFNQWRTFNMYQITRMGVHLYPIWKYLSSDVCSDTSRGQPAKIANALMQIASVGNKAAIFCRRVVSEGTDEVTWTSRFKVHSRFIVKVGASKIDFKCTHYYGQVNQTRNDWITMTNQEYLMPYYMKTTEGDLYYRISPQLSCFAKSSFGYQFEVARMDLDIVEFANVDDGTQDRAEARRREKMESVDSYQTMIGEGDEY